MKKVYSLIFSMLLFMVLAVACKPNGSKNSTNTDNSDGEGATDSTKMPTSDTLQPTSSVPYFMATNVTDSIG